MTFKEKVFVVLVLPIVLLLTVVEPIVEELYLSFKTMQIRKKIAANFRRFKDVYFVELWK